ncbi:MAG TPA: hypothetical protein VJZ71_03015 [Phycisphaerae bacterium]|nr:hypothetical protein [Phycisphaerae bacterium]
MKCRRLNNFPRYLPLKIIGGWLVAFIVLAAASSGGCTSHACMDEFSVELDTVSLGPEDLGATSEQFAIGGRHIDASPSTGRFPAGLAVAKVVSRADGAATRNLRISEMPTDQVAYWNGLLDSLPPVREVAVLKGQGLDPRGTAWSEILREAARIDCRLCLIYGRWERGEGDADLIGVLCDARESRTLSAFRVPIVFDDVRYDDEQDRRPPEGVLSPAEYDAEAELRGLVRDAVWDLAKRDEPTTTTQPSPWQTDDWLSPRDDRLIIEVQPTFQRGP